MASNNVAIALGILIPLAVIIAIFLVVMYVKCKKRHRKRKRNFKEVSFKDNPVMTGKFPDTTRTSAMEEVEDGNRNEVLMSTLIINEEIETSFITEIKTTPLPDNQDNDIRGADDGVTVSPETMGEQSSENINHTGEQSIDDTKQTLSVEQTLNDEQVLNVEQKVNDKQTLKGEQSLNGEQTFNGDQTLNDEEKINSEGKIDIEDTLKDDRTMNFKTILKVDEDNSMKDFYDVNL